ncbi:MAG: methyltransferase [Streptosporangiaceae bacterium]
MADELSLYGALLGDQGGRVGRLLEGMMTSQVTSALARLGVPDQLAGGPLAVDELATRAGAAAGPLRRLLAAAAAYGLVSQDTAGRYTLTPDGELLRSDVDGSARALAIGFFGPPIWASFGRTADVVQDPVPVNPAAPGGVFAYYAAHPEEAAWFAQGMGRATLILVSELARAEFRPLAGGRIVDVGGGQGTLLGYLLQAVPDATGVLLDRPEALAAAPAYLAGTGVARRVELVPGDFLRDVPQGDLHVICHVLHNWADEQARTIIGNCARASQPGGGLMVIDQLLPDGPEPSVAHLMDLIMMMAVGGRERTRAEHEALLGPAGYTLVRDTPLTGVLPWRVLEFERT